MKENIMNICSDVTKSATKIPQKNYLDTGAYKIFDQGKNDIAGYYNDDDGIAKDFPYIIFGDHTRILKYVEEPCFIGADGVKLLKVKNKDFLPKYVFYSLLANPIENHGYSRHFKYFKEVKIIKRSMEEQQKIVNILDSIQNVIENRNIQLQFLQELLDSKLYSLLTSQE